MTSAEEAPRDAIPSAREKDAPAEGEEGWDSREGETEESRGGGDPTQKKDLLDILALAAAAEQVEEPSVAEKAAFFFADPSEGRKGFVDTLLGGGGARARSRRGLQAPRNLADPLSRLTGKEPKEVGLWDNAEVRGRVADAAKSLKVEASIASRAAPAASLPLRDDPAPREKGAEESFDLGSLGHSLSGGRHSSPRFSPPIAPVTGKPRVDRERKRRNAVFNSSHRLDSPHRLAPWGEGVRVTPSLSLSPRHVLDKYDLSDPDGPSFEETHATDDLQFQLDMEWDPVGHHAATRGERRDDVATPELSSDGAEESPVRLRSNRISAASPRFTSRFFGR